MISVVTGLGGEITVRSDSPIARTVSPVSFPPAVVASVVRISVGGHSSVVMLILTITVVVIQGSRVDQETGGGNKGWEQCPSPHYR